MKQERRGDCSRCKTGYKTMAHRGSFEGEQGRKRLRSWTILMARKNAGKWWMKEENVGEDKRVRPRILRATSAKCWPPVVKAQPQGREGAIQRRRNGRVDYQVKRRSDGEGNWKKGGIRGA